VSGIGPNFAPNSVYSASSTNNAIYIYAPNPVAKATPISQIGGTTTALDGPQYLAFDNLKHLFVTNHNAGTGKAAIEEYQTFATGDVIALNGISTGLTDPRGIAIDQKTGDLFIANVNPAAAFPNELLVFPTTSTGSIGGRVISGNLTQLNSPTGVALDSSNNVYVANRGSGTVTVYALPSPTPVPSGSPSPTPSPTPTPNPSASPSGSPSPTPAPGQNVAPVQIITGLGAPTGVAVDAAKNVYVADPDGGNPSIDVFAAGAGGAAVPTRKIIGSSTGLNVPTDVKVDANGTLYVGDSGANAILIFAPNATGNVAPAATIPFSAGTLIGLALSP
jgi:hypothetical protein